MSFGVGILIGMWLSTACCVIAFMVAEERRWRAEARRERAARRKRFDEFMSLTVIDEEAAVREIELMLKETQ